MEEPLSGGNTHEQVVRVGRTVRRPTGTWTAGVHALLMHLERMGYDGAPRARGTDEQGREILDYVEGDVVHPDHRQLIAPNAALVNIVATIRRFHDAVESFTNSAGFHWSDRGRDPTGTREILCHNDLAPWNLVRTTDGRWVFIDWDLAAPGRRSWDLAWAVLNFVPLMPESSVGDRHVLERLRIFVEAYGAERFPADVLTVAVERCEREADLIRRRGAAGEPPYDTLLREGHGDIWARAAIHVADRVSMWERALRVGSARA